MTKQKFPIFGARKIDAVKGRIPVRQLSINGIGQLDAFEADLKDTTYLPEYRTLLTYINFYAENGMLPPNKMKDITPGRATMKEYEFRTKHLRVYAIHGKEGKLILLCGYKNTQEKDIRKFRSLKERYFESLQ